MRGAKLEEKGGVRVRVFFLCCFDGVKIIFLSEPSQMNQSSGRCGSYNKIKPRGGVGEKNNVDA